MAKIRLLLNTVKQKKMDFFKIKNVKMQKHAYRGYASTYNVEILNFFNPYLQLKDSESAIKDKLISLSSQLRGFKF